MSHQLSIFDVPPYQAHSRESRQAAESMSGKTSTLRDQVLQALRIRPMTDEELSTALALNPSTCRPRRIELVQRGQVKSVGTVKGASGRSMNVWSVV
jgi:hypothetical protein